MRPLLRWVGGKSRLLPDLHELIGSTAEMSHYYEPFVGGGALFFDIAGNRPMLHKHISDVNINLMDTYAAVRQNPELVIDIMRSLEEESYAAIRTEFNTKPKIGQCRTAALFLMLNHLCFNGLYRVNKTGAFNVPIGKHGSTVLGTNRPRTMKEFDYDAILRASIALCRTDIKACSFDKALSDAEIHPGHTLVFCDPPYFQEFSSYDKTGFNKSQHCLLAEVANSLRNKGAYVIVCGSDNATSRQIYGTPAKVVTLKRTVGASKRGDANEALYVFAPIIKTILHPIGHRYVEGTVNPKAAGFVKMG